MAIVAYAAGVASPISNSTTDVTVLLASTPLGSVPNKTIYGDATDSLDASPVWTWAWTIVSKEATSAASFVSATAQNPVVQNIDKWENIRIMLVATNTNSGATSETDPLLAPSSAFVVIRVKSTIQAIQKMAKGERNWYNDLYEWADVIESAGAIPAHTITSHSDVTNATGADLEGLSQGGYAVDPAGTNPTNAEGFRPLHKHHGSSINPATTTTIGTAALSESPLSATTPKVINRERITFCGTAETTMRAAAKVFTIEVPTPAVPRSLAHMMWYIPEGMYISHWNVSLLDGGDSAPTNNDYVFELQKTTTPHLRTGWSLVNAATTQTGKPALDNQALSLTKTTTGSTWALAAGETVGLFCTAAPGVVGERGYGLTCTIYCKRNA